MCDTESSGYTLKRDLNIKRAQVRRFSELESNVIRTGLG